MTAVVSFPSGRRYGPLVTLLATLVWTTFGVATGGVETKYLSLLCGLAIGGGVAIDRRCIGLRSAIVAVTFSLLAATAARCLVELAFVPLDGLWDLLRQIPGPLPFAHHVVAAAAAVSVAGTPLGAPLARLGAARRQ
jgi:hypothetical protein